MTTRTICDICGEDAVAKTKLTPTTTEITKDLCEKHMAEWKRIVRAFFKQEDAEILVEDEELKEAKVIVNGR